MYQSFSKQTLYIVTISMCLLYTQAPEYLPMGEDQSYIEAPEYLPIGEDQSYIEAPVCLLFKKKR